ncbi:MAG: hypothetical protein JXA57_00230 [Armatimonadetes bacterium]|nr:hypothetical protein [Armatimonadota bacterium]
MNISRGTGGRAVNISPLMVTAKDDDLLGVSNRSDAMGVLAVWSVRGRDLVPHLTEQTTSVRGFQILVEAFRLWEFYEPAHPQHAGRLDDFFLLIEQAFARTVGRHDKDWSLPGARRVRARSSEEPRISLQDLDWHLLGGQKANGLWGLYRGASRRAGLLMEDMTRLSGETMEQATLHAGIKTAAQSRLFTLVESAMDGQTVALPTNMNNKLTGDLCTTFRDLPLADHLHERLIESHELTKHLAERLLDIEELDHRTFLASEAQQRPGHQATIQDVVRCEDLLAVVEAVFLWLCSSKGKTVEVVAKDLPVDLDALAAARVAFGHSGTYRGETAISRYNRFHEQLDTSSYVALLRSVLMLHEQVSEERKRAPWVWEDQGVLFSDLDVDRPADTALQVGLAWRNDYYLEPLRGIAKQLSEVRK